MSFPTAHKLACSAPVICRYSTRHPRFTFASIKLLMEIMEEYDHFLTFLNTIRGQWSWMDEWLRTYVDGLGYSTSPITSPSLSPSSTPSLAARSRRYDRRNLIRREYRRSDGAVQVVFNPSAI